MPACPSLIELEAYLDVGSDVGIGPHLKSCSDCQARLDELRRNQAFLADCRDAQKPTAAASPSGYPDAPAGYHLIRVVGRGGQAVVYEALQLSTQRRVALKVVRLGTRDAARRRRRFEREIELVSGLRHPSIVTVFDSGITPDGDPYLVMELVAGAPIAYRPDASLADRLREFQQVCSAIRHAHQHGVVHRDIKPSNILVDQNGQPRVLDFGLATTVEARDRLTLTRSGEFLGTPIYAAPEQLSGHAATADVRTDVYSLGLVLYELLTGEHPFVPNSALADIVTGILERDPVRPSSRSRGLNHEIDTIVLKALAKEPQRRYATVDAMEADIARYLRGDPIEAKRDSTWYTLRKTARRHRWAFAGITGFLLLLMTFGIVMAVLYRAARETSLELAEALATRDLDRHIELARKDDLRTAEPQLWREYLNWIETPEEIGDWATGPLRQRRAHWGLWELYQRQPCLRTMRIPSDRVWSMDFLDGGQVLIADGDLTVHQWDALAGVHTRIVLPPPTTNPQRVVVSGDPMRMLVAYPRHLQVWSLDPPEILFDLPAPPGPPIVCWSPLAHPDGVPMVASGHADNTARLWNLEEGTVGAPLHVTDHQLHALNLTNQRLLWIAGPSARHYETHDLVTGAHHRSPALNTSSWFTVTPDGRHVHSRTIWGADGTRIADLEDDPVARVQTFVFGESGRRLIGRGTTTPIWDARDGSLQRVLTTRDATFVALNADDTLLVTSHPHGVIRSWNVRLNQGQDVIAVDGTTHAIRFGPGGSEVGFSGATPELNPLLRVAYATGRGGDAPADATMQVGPISALVWLGPDRLLTGGHDGVLLDWHRTGQKWRRRVLAELGTEINELAKHPTREQVALACNDGSVRIWDGSGPPRTVATHEDRAATVAFAPDGTLVSGGRDGTVALWAEAGRRNLVQIKGTIRVIRTHENPPRIAAAGDDQAIRVWDTDGTPLYEVANGVRVYALAFSPDGTLLATGDASGFVRLWDLPTGTPLANLLGHQHMVFSLDFSPDGHTLASGGSDGTVRLWDLRYFERHMAGNMEYQLAERTADGL